MSNWPFKLDHVHEWAYWNSAFSKEECDLIIELGKKDLITGHVADPTRTKKYRSNIRRSTKKILRRYKKLG